MAIRIKVNEILGLNTHEDVLKIIIWTVSRTVTSRRCAICRDVTVLRKKGLKENVAM